MPAEPDDAKIIPTTRPRPVPSSGDRMAANDYIRLDAAKRERRLTARDTVIPPPPVITVDPAVRFGRPHIKGVSTVAVAGMVYAGESLATVADEYDLSRHEVLLACWHEGLQGVYRAEWGDWAARVHGPLGGWSLLDVDALPDPPEGDREDPPTSEAHRAAEPPHSWLAFDPATRRSVGAWFAKAAEVHEADGDSDTARHATWAAAVFGAYEDAEDAGRYDAEFEADRAVEPFTDADVELVVSVLPVDHEDRTTLVEVVQTSDGPRYIHGRPERLARAVLSALAAAGRLTPSGIQPGHCGHTTTTPAGPLVCTLPSGHRWHRDDTGAEWDPTAGDPEHSGIQPDDGTRTSNPVEETDRLIAERDRLAADLDKARAAVVQRDERIAGLVSEGRAANEPQSDRHAEGYAAAVAVLRDPDRYRNWWTAGHGPIAGPPYWSADGRRHLADYLETVGPDGPDVSAPQQWQGLRAAQDELRRLADGLTALDVDLKDSPVTAALDALIYARLTPSGGQPDTREIEAALAAARQALEHAPQTCRYHGDGFDRNDMRMGLPRCESCQQPYRVTRALAALDAVEREG